MAQNALTKSNEELVGSYLKQYGHALEEYSMRNYNKSAFLKSAMIGMITNPTLIEALKTDAGKRSIFNALRYAATTGLSLNPAEGKAAIIAYKNKNGEVIASYQVMKNGMIDLANDSGKIEFITADLVRMKDDFHVEKNEKGDSYKFTPNLDDRGAVRGFFAALRTKDGHTHVKWMTRIEVEEIRDRYSTAYSYDKTNSAWAKSFEGMGIKTVLKALLRNVRISDELDNAIGADDFYEADFKIENGVSADEANEKLSAKEEKSAPEPVPTSTEIEGEQPDLL